VTFERRRSRLVSVGLDWCGFMRLRGDHAGPEAWVVVEDWTASMVDPDPDGVRRLAELVAGAASTESAPLAPAWWFARLAMEEPGAIQLVALADWRHRAWGVFDPDALSLAVTDGQSLVSYGGDQARRRLLAFLDGCRPLELRELAIEAIPIDEPVPSQAVVLERRHHRFIIRGLD
jgi:protein-L-isoaspartate(D-aspartate) O-methyltransferase